MADTPTPLNKQQEADGIKKTVATVFNSLANVQVITGVGDVTVTLQTGMGKIHSTVTHDGDEFTAFVTQFNLLDGDILTTVPTGYQNHDPVRSLHERNVRMGIATLPGNIGALVGAAESIIKLINSD